ncbi:TRAP transporter large permease [Rhodovulum sp. DZ06]|uniref:TRAP transporter large permease n=1 Tax=Rhodovulum sp. DZ06 TaxID=3425126 RepID=UPI003D33897F
MDVALLFAMIIAMLLIGAPIAVALGLSSTVFLLLYSDSSLGSIAQTLFDAMAGHATLLAIPFFILASSYMSTGGVAKRIIRFAIALVGHLPGGLAIAGVVACMMFAALSGSSPATVVAVGSIVIAGMRQVGYTKDFAAGVICNAGTLGILIPPSIVMVVYATATEVSVGRMFMAGVIPGLLAGVMLMIGIYVAARVRNLPKGDWPGWGEVMTAALDASWGLFLIVIILGGIYGGVFTPTEAAAVSAVYAFFVAMFIYRDMGPLAGKPWLQEGERAVGELGARIWGFAIVAVILYLSLSLMLGFAAWMALVGAAGFTAVILFAGRLLALGGQAGERAVMLLIAALTVVPSLIALFAGVSVGATVGLALFLFVAAALLAFALREAGDKLAATGQDFNASLGLGGKAIARGLGQLALLFFPAAMSKANRDSLFEGGKLTVTLLFIIANALILKHVLTDEQIPQQIASSMLEAGFGPIMFLVIVNVILLIGGQFMEPSGLIIIVAPLVFPIAISLGIDPIHLGIIMVVNMEIGMITPPVGLNLFVTSGVAGMPMMRVVKAALPWLAILFVFLIMVTYIPWLSTWLPTTFMGPEIVVK